MTYDLAMFKPLAGHSHAPTEVYEQLCEGERVDTLEDLSLDPIMASVKDRFPGAVEQLYEWNWRRNDESLIITWSPQHVHFECHTPSKDTLARLIQIAADFDCLLYDPQTGQLVVS
jgi:hypothetical protein